MVYVCIFVPIEPETLVCNHFIVRRTELTCTCTLYFIIREGCGGLGVGGGGLLDNWTDLSVHYRTLKVLSLHDSHVPVQFYCAS